MPFVCFYLTHFRELGQTYFCSFSVHMKTLKFASEIYWPLDNNIYIFIWFDWYSSINTIYFSGMSVLVVPVRLSLGLTLAHGRNSVEFFRIRWKKSLLTLLFLCFVDDRFSSWQPSISLLPFFHLWHVEIRIFKKCDRISLLQMQYK